MEKVGRGKNGQNLNKPNNNFYTQPVLVLRKQVIRLEETRTGTNYFVREDNPSQFIVTKIS